MKDASVDLDALLEHIEELADDYTEDHCTELLGYTRDARPAVRSAAVQALWDQPQQAILEPVVRLADTDPDLEVRATAVSVLGRFIYEGLMLIEGGDDAEPEVDDTHIVRVRSLLEALLHDASRPLLLRRRALEALSFDPGEPDLEMIERWADDPSPDLQVTAIFAMGRCGFERFKPRILEAMSSEVFEVRREAIRAAGEAHIHSALPALEAITRGDSRELMLEAYSAIGDIGSAEAMEFLSRALEDADDEELSEIIGFALERAEELALLEDIESGRAFPFSMEDSEEILN